MTFALAFQFYVYLPWGAFNQEKALVGAFSVIVKTGCGTDGALHSTIRDNPQVESIQRGVGGDTAAAGAAAPDTAAVERELGEIERQMAELERDREDRSRRIMDRRVLQVTTLQELGENPSLQIQFEASNI